MLHITSANNQHYTKEVISYSFLIYNLTKFCLQNPEILYYKNIMNYIEKIQDILIKGNLVSNKLYTLKYSEEYKYYENQKNKIILTIAEILLLYKNINNIIIQYDNKNNNLTKKRFILNSINYYTNQLIEKNEQIILLLTINLF